MDRENRQDSRWVTQQFFLSWYWRSLERHHRPQTAERTFGADTRDPSWFNGNLWQWRSSGEPLFQTGWPADCDDWRWLCLTLYSIHIAYNICLYQRVLATARLFAANKKCIHYTDYSTYHCYLKWIMRIGECMLGGIIMYCRHYILQCKSCLLFCVKHQHKFCPVTWSHCCRWLIWPSLCIMLFMYNTKLPERQRLGDAVYWVSIIAYKII